MKQRWHANDTVVGDSISCFETDSSAGWLDYPSEDYNPSSSTVPVDRPFYRPDRPALANRRTITAGGEALYMFGWLAQIVLHFVREYGFFAVFLYMVLETSFILHFAPSELVVPFAATQLVHGPVTFALFVVDTTVGATLGSALAYYVFGIHGREVLERYGHAVHVSESSLDRSQRVFHRYGESSVFWGRMLPLFRALISIPAGLAEMDARRFVFYSASGAAVFNTALTYLVYSGAGTTSPLELIIEEATAFVDYLVKNLHVAALIVVIVALFVAVVWHQRDRIKASL